MWKWMWAAVVGLMAMRCGWSQEEGRALPTAVIGPEMPGIVVRDHARTWAELVRVTKPSCTWIGKDLLWVKQEKNGATAFAVDEAYAYATAGGGLESVTVRPPPKGRMAFQFTDGEDLAYVRARMEVGKDVADTGEPTPFARQLLHDEKRGDLYELQWPSLTLSGTGHIETSQRVLVLHQGDGQWRVLGECEADGHGEEPGELNTDTVSCAASWSGDRREPVAITLKRRHNTQLLRVDDAAALPELDIDVSGKMVGNGLMTAVWDKREYLVVHPKETVKSLAERLALWQSGFHDASNVALKNAAAELWAGELLRTNPFLANGGTATIAEDAQVILPSREGIEKALEKVRVDQTVSNHAHR
jgi:hypothetical protein